MGSINRLYLTDIFIQFIWYKCIRIAAINNGNLLMHDSLSNTRKNISSIPDNLFYISKNSNIINLTLEDEVWDYYFQRSAVKIFFLGKRPSVLCCQSTTRLTSMDNFSLPYLLSNFSISPFAGFFLYFSSVSIKYQNVFSWTIDS